MAKRGTKPNTERRAEMARLKAEGLTLQQIGDRYGVTRQTVCWLLKQHHAQSL